MAVSLDLAVTAIKAGRKEEGRQLLNLLIQQDPNAELAWLWMSSVVRTDEQRARCLYHVLSINPKNELAHRGLQILGITVSDSRPVKVPRDSEPIHIPQPSTSNGTQAEPKSVSGEQETHDDDRTARRPFLIDLQAITAELPFVPARLPARPGEEIQASPDILALEVDDNNHSEETEPSGPTECEIPTDLAVDEPDNTGAESLTEAAGASAAVLSTGPELETEPQSEQAQKTDSQPGTSQDQPTSDIASGVDPTDSPAEPEPFTSPADVSAETSQITSQPNGETGLLEAAAISEPAAVEDAPEKQNEGQPVQKGLEGASVAENGQSPVRDQQPVAPGNASGGDRMPPPGQPFETRPSQPIPINYPIPNTGLPQSDPVGSGAMAPNRQYQHHGAGTLPLPHYPMMPGSIPVHGNPSMGMPYGQYQRPPSEPVPVIIHPGSIFPPSTYPSGHSFHSSATTLMPTFSEAGLQTHLAQGPAIPTASGTAMPLQNLGWGIHPKFQPNGNLPPYSREEEDDGEEDGEMNMLAVIIFGTLSLTALGGIGMLILLFITTSAVPG